MHKSQSTAASLGSGKDLKTQTAQASSFQFAQNINFFLTFRTHPSSNGSGES